MIPLTMTVRFQTEQGWRFRLWVPLFLIWLFLLPLVLILLPFFCIGCWIMEINPFQALKTFWEILCALKGTLIDVVDNKLSIFIQI